MSLSHEVNGGPYCSECTHGVDKTRAVTVGAAGGHSSATAPGYDPPVELANNESQV
ncbi:MAG TPA: hypothetical protein VEJ87_06420 [Acidimicrobiales bacterium]|nr:hypothetical protein [Acidimicrobiales bacterium]